MSVVGDDHSHDGEPDPDGLPDRQRLAERGDMTAAVTKYIPPIHVSPVRLGTRAAPPVGRRGSRLAASLPGGRGCRPVGLSVVIYRGTAGVSFRLLSPTRPAREQYSFHSGPGYFGSG